MLACIASVNNNNDWRYLITNICYKIHNRIAKKIRTCCRLQQTCSVRRPQGRPRKSRCNLPSLRYIAPA